MKDQVTSIEQSKRLIELGVPTEKASMVWEYWIKQDFSKDPSEEVFYNLNTKANRQIDPSDRDVPAFTVADLLGLIKPIHIFENLWCPCIERTKGNDGWMFEYGGMSEDEDFGYAQCHSIVDLLVSRIEWVVSNGYKLNL